MKSARGPNRPGRFLALAGRTAFGFLVLASFSAVAFSQTPPTTPNPRGYRIAVGDVLQVDVLGRADISGQYPVNKDGEVFLPVLGSVPATGRTTNELGNDISRHTAHLGTSQVTVSVVQTYRRKNFVLGAVGLPDRSRSPSSHRGGDLEAGDLPMTPTCRG